MIIAKPACAFTKQPDFKQCRLLKAITPLQFGKQHRKEKPEPAASSGYRKLMYLLTAIFATGVAGMAVENRAVNRYLEKDKAELTSQLNKKERQFAIELATLSEKLAQLAEQANDFSNRARIAQVIAASAVEIDNGGSGVIIEDLQGKRYILTNSHVIYRHKSEQGKEAEMNEAKKGDVYLVRLYSGSDSQKGFEFETGIVHLPDGGRAEAPMFQGDIALLEIPAGIQLPPEVKPAVMRNLEIDRIQPGETVLAIGNPRGMRDSITSGVISHVERQLPEEPEDLFLQTDAPINSGNSGGGLFDMKGRLIGINTLTDPEADGISGSIRIDVIQKQLTKWGIQVKY